MESGDQAAPMLAAPANVRETVGRIEGQGCIVTRARLSACARRIPEAKSPLQARLV